MMKLISTLLVALLFVSTANAALRGEKKNLLEAENARELWGRGMGTGSMDRDRDRDMDRSRDRDRDGSMDGMSSGRQLMGMGFGWMGMGPGGPMDGTMNGPMDGLMNGPVDGLMNGPMDGTMLGWYCCHPKNNEADCENEDIIPEGCTEEDVKCEWLDDGRCRMVYEI